MNNFMQCLNTWWEALIHPASVSGLLTGGKTPRGFELFLALGISFLYGLYGLSMGLFRGILPAAVSGVKLPFLFMLALVVCFPALYVINWMLGPGLRFRDCLRLLLIAVSANAVALASYAAVSYFFTLTTSREGYHFLVLMHVWVFFASGLITLLVLGLIFRAAAQAMGKPLRPLFVILWGILYGFVGTQMAWAMRPWIGSRSIPYTFFRARESSFIEAVWGLLF